MVIEDLPPKRTRMCNKSTEKAQEVPTESQATRKRSYRSARQNETGKNWAAASDVSLFTEDYLFEVDSDDHVGPAGCLVHVGGGRGAVHRPLVHEPLYVQVRLHGNLLNHKTQPCGGPFCGECVQNAFSPHLNRLD